VGKVVLITGRLARPLVEEVAQRLRELGIDAHVHVAPIPVAAFLTPKTVIEEVTKLRDQGMEIDAVIVPGMVPWSGREVAEILGIPVVKGTKHVEDLVKAIEVLGVEGLDPDLPADEILADRLSEVLCVVGVESERCMPLSSVCVPVRPPPMLIVAEIVNVERLSVEEAVNEARRLIDEGASIVSLGVCSDRVEISEYIRAIQLELGVPIAIDTPLVSVAERALASGASMYLSVGIDNVDRVATRIPRDSAVVVVPSIELGTRLSAEERIALLERCIAKLQSMGFEKLVVDPLLDPPGYGSLIESLIAYREASKRFVDYPMLMGVGNVTELVDADSIGMNALLALIAMEVGASMLLTVEASDKTRNAVAELFIAARMAESAVVGRRPPKDLGVDLLLYKEKRRRMTRVDLGNVPLHSVDGYRRPWRPDPSGFFRVFVDHDAGAIMLVYSGRKGVFGVYARDVDSLASFVADQGLVTDIEHAIYLGRELEKASEALRVGRSYVQDEHLLPSIKEKLQRLRKYGCSGSQRFEAPSRVLQHTDRGRGLRRDRRSSRESEDRDQGSGDRERDRGC